MDKEKAEEIAELVENISDIKISIYEHRNSCNQNEWTENIQRLIQLKEALVHKLINYC